MDKKQLTKLVSFFTMGDGGVYPVGKEHAFIMNMREVNLDYIDWVNSVLQEITRSSYKKIPDYNTDGYTRAPLVRLQTASHPFFSDMRNRIYTGKYKGLDPHALKLLDAEALAILYMCDGCLRIEQPNDKKRLVTPSPNVTLNLKRLSYGDQWLLKKALRDNLGLEWNINRHYEYYYLRLRNKDVSEFMRLVTPHVLPSFEYKIIRTIGSEKSDDDIVCSIEESIESARNEQAAL